jgi:hypothetical protein
MWLVSKPTIGEPRGERSAIDLAEYDVERTDDELPSRGVLLTLQCGFLSLPQTQNS